jgi:D-lactate dehydrogenase
MRLALFSANEYDHRYFDAANAELGHEIEYIDARLSSQTARLAQGFDGVCAFVNDELNAEVVATLAECGVRVIACRCAGFNNVDIAAAYERGIPVVRVPAYSPYAVAEHATALVLALNRRLIRAHQRVREGDFSLAGLEGFDIHGKTVGVVGTGRIGTAFAAIFKGFGARLLATDPIPNDDCRALGVEFVELSRLLAESDIVSLHLPLTPESHHLLDAAAFEQMKSGAMLINTSRGGLIDTRAAIAAIKSGHLGSLGLDVYEEEGDLFFRDLSDTIIQDDTLMRLTTFPNVIVTAHQAFFTREALTQIAETTLRNVGDIESGQACANRVTLDMIS